MTQPRRFHLQRDLDVTGASGTGRVADGIQWPDGTVSIRWRGERPSVVFWASIQDAEQVHGHGGASRIVWDDLEDGYTPPPPGSDRDALPDELRRLIEPQMRPYLSTACETARACQLSAEVFPDQAGELQRWEERQHASCRLSRKQDLALCQCDCHTIRPGPGTLDA